MWSRIVQIMMDMWLIIDGFGEMEVRMVRARVQPTFIKILGRMSFS
jgi:hypothetical protein